MDFLEIRRKAKERAAARAAAATRPAAPAPAGADGPPAPTPATPPPARPPVGVASRRPLALDPLPLPDQAPVSLSPLPEAEEPRPAPPEEPPVEADPPAGPGEPAPDPVAAAAAAALEAAKLEEELELRLRDMPVAPDARFRTWRPPGGATPDLPAVAPAAEPEEDDPPDGPRRGERRQAGPGGRRGAGAAGRPALPPGDPLDEFFFRDDEPGPELGLGSAPPEAAAQPAEASERVEYLTFLLGAEEYGVEIERVREVMRSPPITEVPRAPADVLGVITVRGEVVAVFDPRGRLGLPRAGRSEGGRVIIVDDGAGPLGLLVDSVASVVRLRRGAIEARPQGIGGANADCLEGIGRDRDRLFTVLSIPALLKPGRRAEGRG